MKTAIVLIVITLTIGFTIGTALSGFIKHAITVVANANQVLK